MRISTVANQDHPVSVLLGGSGQRHEQASTLRQVARLLLPGSNLRADRKELRCYLKFEQQRIA